MPRKLIKQFLPSPKKIREMKSLQVLGDWLHDPNLWHLNRRSVSGAVAVGLFYAWIPVPFQMLLSAITAVPLRVNLPISVALVWITNPLTMPPMFYSAYRVGAWLLGTNANAFKFELSIEWLAHGLAHVWKPFLTGCFLLATLSAILGFIGMRFFWRYWVMKEFSARRLKRKLRRAKKSKKEI